MIKLINWFFTWLKSLFGSKYRIKFVKEEPLYLKDSVLYVVGENGFSVFSLLSCPCGCKNKIYLNMLPGKKPKWTLKEAAGIPTLSPSVWRKVGCKSHFFLKSGEIVWADKQI